MANKFSRLLMNSFALYMSVLGFISPVFPEESGKEDNPAKQEVVNISFTEYLNFKKEDDTQASALWWDDALGAFNPFRYQQKFEDLKKEHLSFDFEKENDKSYDEGNLLGIEKIDTSIHKDRLEFLITPEGNKEGNITLDVSRERRVGLTYRKKF